MESSVCYLLGALSVIAWYWKRKSFILFDVEHFQESINKSQSGNQISNAFFICKELQRISLHQEIYNNVPLSAFERFLLNYNVTCTSLAQDTFETIQKKVELPKEIRSQSLINIETCLLNCDVLKCVLAEAVAEIEKIEGKVSFNSND